MKYIIFSTQKRALSSVSRELLTHNQEVVGASPTGPTLYIESKQCFYSNSTTRCETGSIFIFPSNTYICNKKQIRLWD